MLDGDYTLCGHRLQHQSIFVAKFVVNSINYCTPYRSTAPPVLPRLHSYL
jgi:hypothetical protein